MSIIDELVKSPGCNFYPQYLVAIYLLLPQYDVVVFRQSRIPWDLLLQMSVKVILERYGITEGNIGIDDTDKRRSKSTKKIFQVHKIKDKPSGGYIMGHEYRVFGFNYTENNDTRWLFLSYAGSIFECLE